MGSGLRAQAARNRAARPARYAAGESLDFLRQKNSAAAIPAAIVAMAPLFRPAWSPGPGTACLAFCLPTAFVRVQMIQPKTALRRLMIDIPSPFPVREPSKRVLGALRPHGARPQS